MRRRLVAVGCLLVVVVLVAATASALGHGGSPAPVCDRYTSLTREFSPHMKRATEAMTTPGLSDAEVRATIVSEYDFVDLRAALIAVRNGFACADSDPDNDADSDSTRGLEQLSAVLTNLGRACLGGTPR